MVASRLVARPRAARRARTERVVFFKRSSLRSGI
jgi:hypothetical protein